MKGKRLTAALAILLLWACGKDDKFSSWEPSSGENIAGTATRAESVETRSVMLLYSAGYNSISSYLTTDIAELDQGFVPERNNRTDHVLLVFTRNMNTKGEIPVLFQIYKDSDGSVLHDTLRVWTSTTDAASATTMREVLTEVHDRFPANTTGVVFSSHATGWLPAGYYQSPSTYEQTHSTASSLKRSLGQDNYTTSSVEMELKDLDQAIPYKLDYFLIDACLSGCVEVAWQLKGKADIVGFSPAEVLADGFNYKTITTHLLQGTPDPIAVCRDYFDSYDVQTGDFRSATISVVDTREMDALAQACKPLFEKYRSQLSTMGYYGVQGYFRYFSTSQGGPRHYFFDLEDVLVQAGMDSTEKAAVDEALDRCIIYKAATDNFLLSSYGFTIRTYSGLSMYLPSAGTALLNSFYKENIAWNQATELVK